MKSLQAKIVDEICNYFQESSVHGLSYLGKRSSHFFVKIFWAGVVVFGFLTTWILFQLSENDRHERPLITTIESMAVPVQEIDFPAVTVCQDFHSLPDSWAMVRAVTNSFQYRCDRTTVNCSSLTYIHRRFQPFVKQLYDSISELVDQKLQGESLDELRSFTTYKKGYKITKELVLRNISTLGEIMEAAKFNLPRYKNFHTFLNKEFPVVTTQVTSCPNCSALLEDIDRLVLKGVILFFDGMLPIGSTLEAFGPSFGSSFVKFHVYDRLFSCTSLTSTELEIYKALQEIGVKLGMSHDEKVSLFDLPSLIHFGGLKNYYIKYYLRLLTPYSTCARAGWNQTVVDSGRKNILRDWRDQLRACASIWDSYVSGNDSDNHPCKGQEEDPCCFRVMKLMQGDLELLLMLMKHSYHLGSVQSVTDDFISFLNSSNSDSFNSPLVSDRDLKSSSLKQQKDRLAMIPICSFTGTEKKETFQGRDRTNDCRLFKPIWTDKGVCQSFNSISPRKLLVRSEFKSVFEKVFGREGSTDDLLQPGISGGDNQGISFYLDRQTFLHGDEIRGDQKQSSSFLITIDNAFNAFHASRGPTKIRMGYETKILVKPEQLSSDPNLKMLDISQRKCRFLHEVKRDSMFKYYTQNLCIFQCTLQKSFKKCKCIPWGYPRWNSTVMDVCNTYGTYCFEKTMRYLTNHNEDCDCQPDCDSVQFTYTEKEWPLDIDEECSASSNFLVNLILQMNHMWKRAVESYNYLKNGITIGEGPFYQTGSSKEHKIEFCKAILSKDIARVSIQMDSEKFTRYKQSIKLSFTDQVASFGGTLGLLTGMSFVSIIEIVYWLAKLIVSITKRSE